MGQTDVIFRSDYTARHTAESLHNTRCPGPSPALEHLAPLTRQRENATMHFGQPTAAAAAASFLIYKARMLG
jgi:hypothetical protein